MRQANPLNHLGLDLLRSERREVLGEEVRQLGCAEVLHHAPQGRFRLPRMRVRERERVCVCVCVRERERERERERGAASRSALMTAPADRERDFIMRTIPPQGIGTVGIVFEGIDSNRIHDEI